MLKKNIDLIIVFSIIFIMFIIVGIYDHYYPDNEIMKIQIKSKIEIKHNRINLPLKVTEIVVNPNNGLCDLVIKDSNEREFWVNEPNKENCNYQLGDLIK